MQIELENLAPTLNEARLLAILAEHLKPSERTLISGGHQMLLEDGRLEGFGTFSEVSAELAMELDVSHRPSKLFMQINDQLNFQGIREGIPPAIGTEFWSEPWNYIKDEGLYPSWSSQSMLESGLNIHGEPCTGLVSEWQLQQWHYRAGLTNRGRFNNRDIHHKAYAALRSRLGDKTPLHSCRANGCAHEVMVQAPFCRAREFDTLLGFWPLACQGSALFGSTLAALLMDLKLKSTRRMQAHHIEFTGPFTYIHVFLNTFDQPRCFSDLLKGASICMVKSG